MLPDLKETHYFSSAERRGWGWSWYESRFPVIVGGVRGEIDPDYFSSVDAAMRLRETIGDIPVVVILREPLSRSYSQYVMSLRRGQDERAFSEALSEEAEVLRGGDRLPDTRDYLWRSLYGRHLQRFSEYFSQIHVVKFDELFRDDETGLEAYRALREFIGLHGGDSEERDVSVRANAGSAARVRLLSRVLGDDSEASLLRRFAKRVVSSREMRWKMRSWLDNWNRSRTGTAPPMSSVDELPVDALALLREDLLTVEKITGLDIAHWRDRLNAAA